MPQSHLKFHAVHEKRRILIAEDEGINRELLERMLQADYELVIARTGAQALEKLETEGRILSAVLLDLNLPDMNGLVILRGIREDARTAGIPVIVMTDDQEAEVECLRMGAIDFIPTPYPRHEVILARIQRTIELSEDKDIISWTERDQVTGIYNREFFYRYAVQLDIAHQDQEMDAVVLDIVHFHLINERHGRAYGDAVLKKVSDALMKLRENPLDIFGRREADIFLIYCTHRENYEAVYDRLMNEIGRESNLRLRMGVYPKVDRTIDVERRFDRAKLATEIIRSNYSKLIGYYDQELQEKEAFNEQLMDEFRQALLNRQFTVYYQPKFDVRAASPRLNSAEALVRWNHPKLGLLAPAVFVPLFEENGLIRDLDLYVWRETAAQIREWKEHLRKSIPVSVNVSRIDLYDPELMENLESISDEFGIDRAELMPEITESAYTENSDQMVEVVQSLRQAGFRIEMDDFGSGYSSLNMISTLPIDAMKLDMQFVRTAFRERKDTRLLEAVIGLAKSLNLPTVAEGVETAEQMFTLKAMGCDVIQGYYFSRPLPAEAFESYVRGLKEEAGPGLAPVGSGKTVRKGAKDRYAYDAMHDPLTGLYNGSAFDILFQDSDKSHTALMIVAVDDYDAILRSRGREYADRLILRAAEVLRGSFRSADNICRLQESQFAVIMTRMTVTMRTLVTEKAGRINESLRNPPDGQPAASMSAGVAFSDRHLSPENVFENAETALRRARQTGNAGCEIF